MDVIFILLPFVLVGIAVVFVAFSGGPGAARDAYLTKGGTAFRVLIPTLYIVLGLIVPAVVIANRHETEGGYGRLEQGELSPQEERGKQLFESTCASCHTLAAVNARGVTGPNLDEIGQVTKVRILNAIKNGGTGQDRMPSSLLQGEDAEDVAVYVSRVAGK